MGRFITFLLIFTVFSDSQAQRSYRPHSVLSSGTWYKFGVTQTGVHKIDVSFLTGLGVNTSGLSSGAIRIFGNGGAMKSESNASVPSDDLEENAVFMNDGNDGIFNGSDFLLFYAQGPDVWEKDSLNKRFSHKKNIYTDTAFYFLTVGGTGKRITGLQINTPAQVQISSFNERFFHELDSVNLLSSGKEWFGEEFMNAPGKTLSRTFSVSWPGIITSEPLTLISDCIARSVNVSSRFEIRLNSQLVQVLDLAATGPGIYDVFARQTRKETVVNSLQENLQLNYTYIPGGFNAQAWLNWFEIHGRRSIRLPSAGQLLFRDWNSVASQVGEFVVSNAGNSTQIWDVTDPISPVLMQGVLSGNELRFKNSCDRLREYVAFNSGNVFTPASGRRIPNQDLHGSGQVDYLIITHELLLTQARRVADFHRQKNNLNVLVALTSEVFNEFSSGAPDPVAIRDFVKMFYDRASGNSQQQPRYLLLFGDGSFDYKNRIQPNTNLVPAYQSNLSLDPLSTYTSDDFFGFLDDQEDINSGLVLNLLDVGIGRVPAGNPEEAKNFTDKLIAYHAKESMGPWKNVISFVSDDEDNNLHLDDAEIITGNIESVNPLFNLQKIYLDAYRQESGAAGARYPEVNEAINNRILNGALIFNYNGHGGAFRLAEEVILDQNMINGWTNQYRLPLFITATCDFAPYDNPFIKSIGENLILRPKTGAIALMTTTRLVFSFSNRVMNNNYLQIALQPDARGAYKRLGEAVRDAKNYTYQTSGDLINNRKFSLLGDPAMTLGFPEFTVHTTRINSSVTPLQTDTLRAGQKVTIEGELKDNNGALLTGFNGTVYPLLFDKLKTISTLGNDPGSQVTDFRSYKNVLFRGKATVTNGRFSFEFKMPKDLDFQFGKGKLSYYAENGITEGSGLFQDFLIGGTSTVQDADKEGPLIKAWLNDEKFVNGSITNEKPILILHFSDSSGINTSSSGIGHDIVLTIDNENNRYYILNDFYEAALDDYRQGKIRFQLPSFESGWHSLKIKAWDVLNNSGETTLDFQVVNDEQLTIKRVLNYPNPFTSYTQFWFEHNKPGQDLQVQIHIYTLTGRILRTIQKTINTAGNRSCELEWDGKDEFGDKVARGVYLYRLKVQAQGAKPQTAIEKMVIL